MSAPGIQPLPAARLAQAQAGMKGHGPSHGPPVATPRWLPGATPRLLIRDWNLNYLRDELGPAKSHATARHSPRLYVPLPSKLRSQAPCSITARNVGCPCLAETVQTSADQKTEDYNATMAKQMGWDANPYEYHFERGLYYHEIAPNLFCGSMPRMASDVDELKELGVTAVVNLQQDKDLQYWGVCIDEIKGRYHHHGVKLIRHPAKDFDPHSLRKTLPAATQAVHEHLKEGGRVYVHCTAGLGRAPAVCIAYNYWFGEKLPNGLNCLDTVYAKLTAVRPCGPKKDAVRGATFDLLDSRPFHDFEHLPGHAFATIDEDDKQALHSRISMWNGA
eukprot:gene5012-34797_t